MLLVRELDDALGQSDVASGALLTAVEARDGNLAKEIMENNRLELLSSLDLKRVKSTPDSLKEVASR